MHDLFSPFTLRDVTQRNRIVMSPMTMYRSPPDGTVADFSWSSAAPASGANAAFPSA